MLHGVAARLVSVVYTEIEIELHKLHGAVGSELATAANRATSIPAEIRIRGRPGRESVVEARQTPLRSGRRPE